MELFAQQKEANRKRVQPLPVRMRPRGFDEFVGQEAFVSDGRLLRRMIEADRLVSVIFYGPPGTGKTTLASVIAETTASHFSHVNAATVGVREVREILDAARQRLEAGGQRSILFVDELHRFNKAQQDILLADVEDGIITFIGATTENPFFAVNSALTSRSQIFQFEPLDDDAVARLIDRALTDGTRGLGQLNVTLRDDARDYIIRLADGDARRALAALEIAALSQQRAAGLVVDEGNTPERRAATVIDLAAAKESIQRKAIRYDRKGDGHYDTISAMIKSVRGSDPDAAVYWLARMLEAGEDPRFIARRLVILAAEDIGNADPQGLVVAQAAADATHFIGLPECELPLAQAAIYLSTAPKSNASARAIWDARKDVRDGKSLPVPKPLRCTHYAGAARLGSGEGYVSPHDVPKGEDDQEYLGVSKVYYTPAKVGAEAILRDNGFDPAGSQTGE